MSFEFKRAFSDIESCVHLIDLFVRTQGGHLRRVTIPVAVGDVACWLLDPSGSNASGEGLDTLVCERADRDRCGYSEAFASVMHTVEDDYNYRVSFDLAVRDEAYWDALCRRFFDDQAEKEKVWRTAHNDWRDPLPPALD
jgi:hypothetical protein